MRDTPTGTGFAATDLGAFLECAHRSVLDLAVAEGKLERPAQNEIERRLLEKRGREHERRVLQLYESSGKSIVDIAPAPGREGEARAAAQTLEAMRAGAEVIYQGVLSHESWSGRPDFLIRVGDPARPSYEVVDAKLAREARGAAILQLCVYTDHLTRIQGSAPRHFHIAAGGDPPRPIALLTADYMAYYRAVRDRFEHFMASRAEPPYPEPVEHCGVCRFWKRCEERRRADEHLSLVAGITRRQRDRLALSGVRDLPGLAALAPGASVEGIGTDALTRIREQARLQMAGRLEGKPRYELLRDAAPGTGLEALPLPTPGDLFLDLEGDSFVQGDGLEYLFGLLDFGKPSFDFTPREAPGERRYHAFWASNPAEEKRAFERVIDRITQGREEFRGLHVFHFGHREVDAVKKLSCRHKTREEAVDTLLREHVFVDLHAVVRHGLRASVEGYTLKQLEVLHGFERRTELRDAARAMQLFGWWLETGEAELELPELRRAIASYNEDDCISTWRLRDWLEERRRELESLTGRKLARPALPEPVSGEERKERNAESMAVARRLTAGLPEDPAGDLPAQAGRRLLANLLDWHWREAKSGWWEYHRARELPPKDRLDDRSVLGGLEFEAEVRRVRQSIVYRYTFPEQEHALRVGSSPIDPDTQKEAGLLLDVRGTTLELQRGIRSTAPHPVALIPDKPIDARAQEESLLAIGTALAGDPEGSSFSAARSLLTRAAPRAGQARGEALLRDGESIEQCLSRLALGLDGSVLAVQGPPGSGKTHQAALVIRELVRAGKRVGVTANSHAVIKNLLYKVAQEAGDVRVRALHVDKKDDAPEEPAPFETDNKKERIRARLDAGELDVVGGTAWVWAHAELAGSIDVLIVDEAGQMSLANVLAVSRAARSLILFGDPAQLEQPQKGVHPPGADASALEHLLGGDALTIPPELGVFLPKTRRLHPTICAFVSEVFYEGRLHPDASLGLERQVVTGPDPFAGAGLRYLAVPHRGNTNQSDEEVETIRGLLIELLGSRSTFTPATGPERPLTARDVLVVSPYNAQVAALRRALPADVRVGTVDKFQGQEAPIVIYSMATSSGEDAPRGLEFLYSLNRLNVAVSRAQALCVLVGSPELSRVACRSPRQMKLVNALCTYLEMAGSRAT